MKLLKNLLLFLLVLGVALSVIAQFLPAEFRVERNVIIRATPEKLMPLVNDLRRWPEWTVWSTNADPTVVYIYEGPTEGVGAISKWQGKKFGAGSMTITESDPAKGLKLEVRMGAGQGPATGWLTFAPAGTDTKVIFGLGGKLSRNPIERWMCLLMDKMAGPEFEQNLRGLKRLAEAN
jgi:hypothetical protein